ncbi:MAG: TRAP transporter substrate-binding protein DctP [Gammaproteobacteria bacterium]
MNRLAVLLAFIAAAFLAGADAATTLRITLQLPIKNILGQNLVAFKNKVEATSNGDLNIEIYDSSQLYKDKEVAQAVSSGAIEMGVASLTLFAGTIPAVDIFYVPFLFSSDAMVGKATAPGSPIRAPLDDAILNTGVRVLWWQAFGNTVMLSKGKPLRTPADMKGLKVRVFGKTLGDFVETVGGVPTLISGSEQYLAYQRGTVDAGLTGITSVTSRKLYEVVDTITVANIADIEFLVLINEQVWQGLGPVRQDILATAAREVEQDLRSAMADEERKAFAEAEQKASVVVLTEQELAAWRQAAEPVKQKYLDNAGELGKKLLDAAQTLH